MKLFIALFSVGVVLAQDPDAGRRNYQSRCVSCHGGDGAGGEHGPSIVNRIGAHNDSELTTIITEGLPNQGMPAFKMPNQESTDLIAFLRTLRPSAGHGLATATVETTDGRKLEGAVLNQTSEDLQLRTGDKRVHLLRKVGGKFREVTSQTDWPSY